MIQPSKLHDPSSMDLPDAYGEDGVAMAADGNELLTAARQMNTGRPTEARRKPASVWIHAIINHAGFNRSIR